MREAATMRRQVDHHLARARAVGRRGSAAQSARNVWESVEAVERAVARLYPRGAARHGWQPRGGRLRVERQDLDEMLGNLIENAAKYGGGSVFVTTVDAVPDDAQIRAKSGSRTTAWAFPRSARIFDRGARLDTGKPGTGLGLAIVRDVAEIYGGAVQPRSASRERGSWRAAGGPHRGSGGEGLSRAASFHPSRIRGAGRSGGRRSRRAQGGGRLMIAIFAALSAALAIAAGAFGAHGASSPQAAEWLRTGGMYQLVHAVAALVLMQAQRGPAIVMLIGAVIFAGTLYLMALGAPRWLGAITPIGGSLLIVAWLWAAWGYYRA
jgi:uncharacterized membrane protein YgdD (TMEM256/DUF423 family)